MTNENKFILPTIASIGDSVSVNPTDGESWSIEQNTGQELIETKSKRINVPNVHTYSAIWPKTEADYLRERFEKIEHSILEMRAYIESQIGAINGYEINWKHKTFGDNND